MGMNQLNVFIFLILIYLSILISGENFLSIFNNQIHLFCNSVLSKQPETFKKLDIIFLNQSILTELALKIKNYHFNNYEYHKTVFNPVFISRVTPEIWKYSTYSQFNHLIYALRSNSIILPFYPDSSLSDYKNHRKIIPILDTLNNDLLFCDYVVWMDSDAIFLDLNFELKNIVSSYSQYHIILSKDASNLANSGMIIVRNSLTSRKILSSWLKIKDEEGVINDQVGLERIYHQFKRFIKVLPMNILNSRSPAFGEQKSYDKILHLAAESDTFRLRVFQHAAQELCQSFLSDPTLRIFPSQLGLNRTVLQNYALDIYGEDYMASRSTLEHSCLVSLPRDSLDRFRHAQSKFSYVLLYMARDQNQSGGAHIKKFGGSEELSASSTFQIIFNIRKEGIELLQSSLIHKLEFFIQRIYYTNPHQLFGFSYDILTHFGGNISFIEHQTLTFYERWTSYTNHCNSLLYGSADCDRILFATSTQICFNAPDSHYHLLNPMRQLWVELPEHIKLYFELSMEFFSMFFDPKFSQCLSTTRLDEFRGFIQNLDLLLQLLRSLVIQDHLPIVLDMLLGFYLTTGKILKENSQKELAKSHFSSYLKVLQAPSTQFIEPLKLKEYQSKKGFIEKELFSL